MKVEHNLRLEKYTTLKIGGLCKELYFPQTANELILLYRDMPDIKILGGGSNLLISDQEVFNKVICLREYEKDLIVFDDNKVTVSAGVTLQKLILTINSNGLGGIEYLYSVPGLVGGAIYMNAGRGRGANKQISDFLISVDVLEDGEIKTYSKNQCMFNYRSSIFQSKKCIILKAVFVFNAILAEEGKKLRKERIEICKKFQDGKYPNAGTTFSLSDPIIMKWVKILTSKNKKNGIKFSSKVTNWLQNRGDGTYKQAMRLINRVIIAHKIFGKECKLEYEIWDSTK